MAEPEEPSSIPTEIQAGMGGVPSPSVKRLDRSAMEALLTAARPGAQRGSTAWQLPTPEELQRDFPQYEIAGVLGRGGMGAVYKGWQKSLDRYVAIKILPPEVQDLDPHFAERFKHEAKAMAHLSHPAICPVFDAGETPGGLLYFVMEFIEGGDLGQKIAAQGRFQPAEAVAIARTLCDALQAAHESGIVHRDIKPSNILLHPHGEWKVADFGLAKLTGQPEGDLTLSDTAMGSPGFAAPEALMDGASVDHRADIYAAGVILYQMLTGSIPRGAFDMPSQLVPGLDPRFDTIVAKAMQPDRERRYASAVAMRRDLELAAADGFSTAPSESAESVVTPSIPARGPQSPAFRRAAIAGGLILLIGGGWWMRPASWSGPPTRMVESGPSPRAAESKPGAATKEQPFVNSLGLKFVPVPITGGPSDGQRVLFSVWETRVQDFEMFVTETRSEWEKPTFPQGPTHPVVNVSWDDTQAFCAWLTDRERKAGRLGTAERYRLPTDHEWSCAVGIGDREDPARPPGEKSQELIDDFPWRGDWPPPRGAGNYSGEEAAGRETWKDQAILAGYRDDFPYTAPVGSFTANPFGLFDLGGNAWEWCEDVFNPAQASRVMRGASFNNGGRGGLYSAKRDRHPPGDRKNNYGFRLVVVTSPSALPAAAGKAQQDASTPASRTTPWRDALAESPLKEVIARAAPTPQGYLLPDDNHWRVPPQSLRRGALRVRATSSAGHFVSLCLFLDDGDVYRVRFPEQRKECVLSHGTAGLAETDTSIRSGISCADGKPHDVLFARASGRLVVMLDGNLLHEVADPSSVPGRFALDIFHEAKIFVDKMEYVNLDGVSESEAMKLLNFAAAR